MNSSEEMLMNVDKDNDDFDDLVNNLPDDVIEAANQVINDILPEKSRDRYENAYTLFVDWLETKKISIASVTEKVVLAYFHNLSEKK